MCIQFVYINNDADEDEWQVIIANNRDESYTRPTKPAGFWDDHYACISGIDLAPGKEGGTWLGINTSSGKIGTLLNVLENSKPTEIKRGRGHLVSNFLKSVTSAENYIYDIEETSATYLPFNFVVLEYDYSSGRWKSTYSTNEGEYAFQPLEIEEEVYGISNSVMFKPWQKVIDGTTIFQRTVEEYQKVEDANCLQADLMAMLNDSYRYLPDPVLENDAKGILDDEVTLQASGIYMDSRQIQFGTRTNTLIFIDKAGNGKYIERTMVEPVNYLNPIWDTQTIPFHIHVML